MSVIAVPFRRALRPRDPHEPGRAATPLELFFDLIFVVAIASNAVQLHHGITEGHLDAVVGYTLAWFAIWWAWMGYTWYASAYDNDDVVFRLLTFVIMAGCLVLAAGIPDLFADGQSVTVVVGYAVMRLGMVALWVRAAINDPSHRATALTYAVGITIVQALWVARLWAPEGWWVATFALLVAAELSVPFVAERQHGATTYHPHHIAERYALLTIIVLGEVILSTVLAIQGAMASSSGDEGSGGHTAPYAAAASGSVGPEMLPLIIGGLLIVFSLWWLYFERENADLVDDRTTAFVFGYAHLLVFASGAAVGAALAAAVDVVGNHSESSDRTVGVVLGVSVAVFLLTLSGLHALRATRPWATVRSAALVSVGVLVVPFLGLGVQWSILLVGLVLAAAVAEHVVHSGRGVTA